MATNPLNDISKIYYEQILESSHLETDMKKRAEENENARKEMKKTAAYKSMAAAAAKKFDEAAKPDYLDFDGDGNETESMKKALKDRKEVKEAKKPNDGNLANNYPPYDKVTRGDVIAGRLGKDQMGGKKKSVKEGFSNWREDLYEVIDKIEPKKNQDQRIVEKDVNNKVVINPKLDLGEAVKELGGTLLEMVEIDEFDYILESAYDELLEEGYDDDEIEEALEFALTEAKVTFGHDTPTAEKKKEGLLSAARKRLSAAKVSAKAAVARGARKVAKGALGVARKMEGGDKKPHPKSPGVRSVRAPQRPPSGAGQKERLGSGPSKAEAPKKKAEPVSDPWEGSYKKSSDVKTKKTTTAAKPKAKVATKKKKSNLDDLLSSIRSEAKQMTGHGSRLDTYYHYDMQDAGVSPSDIRNRKIKGPKKKDVVKKEELEIDEKVLTAAETKEKERLVKSMKDKAADFEKRYPGRGKEVMYATATKMAKRMAEQAMELQPKSQAKEKPQNPSAISQVLQAKMRADAAEKDLAMKQKTASQRGVNLSSISS